MKEKRERLDPYLSVFNCHSNNARKKADAEFVLQFGQEAFDKHIAPLHESGIIAIFHKKPNEYTGPWVSLVTYFVNQRR